MALKVKVTIDEDDIRDSIIDWIIGQFEPDEIKRENIKFCVKGAGRAAIGAVTAEVEFTKTR
jgi:S-adenosylmethionine synthetase